MTLGAMCLVPAPIRHCPQGIVNGFYFFWSCIFLMVLPASAVCRTCFGNAAGCTSGEDGATCPWNTDVASNIVALATVGGLLRVSRLLPAKFLRIFPGKVLQAISALCARSSTNGTPWDATGKTHKEIVQAAQNQLITKQEARDYIFELISDLDIETDDKFDSKTKVLELSLQMVNAINEKRVNDTTATDGAMLYVLFELSRYFSTSSPGSTSFELVAQECDEDYTKTVRSYSASLKRPKTEIAMCSLLNAFMLLCPALGLATTFALAPFLEDVIYEPCRNGAVPWPVAFESMLIYLRLIESHSSEYNVANVVQKAGGIDSIRAQALVSARANYDGAFFCGLGGNPRPGVATPDSDTRQTGKQNEFTGRIKGFNAESKRTCTHFNKGTKHTKADIDDRGFCKYNHACDQFVLDKGKFGKCLGNHKRSECDYDPTQRCNTPVKA